MHVICETQLTPNQFRRSSTCEQYIVQQNCRHNEKYNNNLLPRNLFYDTIP